MTPLPPGIEEQYGLDDEARRIARLIAGFLRGTLSSEEHRELERWVEASDRHMQLFEELTDEAAGSIAPAAPEPFFSGEGILSATTLKSKQRVPRILRRFVFPAAAVLLLWLAVARWFPYAPSTPPLPTTVSADKPTEADSLHPLLTLNNGTAILLSAEHDTSFQLPTVGRLSCGPGGLFYPSAALPPRRTVEHALSTPRRQTFRVVLADGTRVWLNGSSRLSYPALFSGPIRTVHLKGEAYFEVAPDRTRPFVVHTGTLSFQVLGTSFNIEAYDSHVRATLLEGSLRVKGEGHEVILAPGEELQVQSGGSWHKDLRADVAGVLGWQNGLFVFRGDSIRRILTELSCWYNLDPAESDPIPYRFTATIPRELPLERVLAILELTGRVRFHLQGRTLRAKRTASP